MHDAVEGHQVHRARRCRPLPRRLGRHLRRDVHQRDLRGIDGRDVGRGGSERRRREAGRDGVEGEDGGEQRAPLCGVGARQLASHCCRERGERGVGRGKEREVGGLNGEGALDGGHRGHEGLEGGVIGRADDNVNDRGRAREARGNEDGVDGVDDAVGAEDVEHGVVELHRRRAGPSRGQHEARGREGELVVGEPHRHRRDRLSVGEGRRHHGARDHVELEEFREQRRVVRQARHRLRRELRKRRVGRRKHRERRRDGVCLERRDEVRRCDERDEGREPAAGRDVDDVALRRGRQQDLVHHVHDAVARGNVCCSGGGGAGSRGLGGELGCGVADGEHRLHVHLGRERRKISRSRGQTGGEDGGVGGEHVVLQRLLKEGLPHHLAASELGMQGGVGGLEGGERRVVGAKDGVGAVVRREGGGEVRGGNEGLEGGEGWGAHDDVDDRVLTREVRGDEDGVDGVHDAVGGQDVDGVLRRRDGGGV
mmetsp:Transcript_10138/g.20756  ORF Transcript_10138/g.20756 Transcript_10138/m.20756 type:complete len:482 (+) Transcript_10138:706-2151(+)